MSESNIPYMHEMTLRDYFAGQALAGIAWAINNENPQMVAHECYVMADAMLEARKNK